MLYKSRLSRLRALHNKYYYYRGRGEGVKPTYPFLNEVSTMKKLYELQCVTAVISVTLTAESNGSVKKTP